MTAHALILTKGGKTGRKLHKAFSGSSCLYCGHWCKYVVNNWLVRPGQEHHYAGRVCESCFAPGTTPEQARQQIDDFNAKWSSLMTTSEVQL